MDVIRTGPLHPIRRLPAKFNLKFEISNLKLYTQVVCRAAARFVQIAPARLRLCFGAAALALRFAASEGWWA